MKWVNAAEAIKCTKNDGMNNIEKRICKINRFSLLTLKAKWNTLNKWETH